MRLTNLETNSYKDFVAPDYFSRIAVVWLDASGPIRVTEAIPVSCCCLSIDKDLALPNRLIQLDANFRVWKPIYTTPPHFDIERLGDSHASSRFAFR